jgi:hypothetical protein
MPWTIHFRGQFDRQRGRVLLESLDALFANSHLHLSGSVEKIPWSPELDLVVTLERSRFEDLVALGRRFSINFGNFAVQGRVDGMLAIQGPWAKRRYGGFVSVRDGVVNTASGTFPVSELAVWIDNRGARLAPARVTLAPRVELVVEGTLDRRDNPPRYALVLSVKGVPLQDVLGFGRALLPQARDRGLQGLDATGWGTATLRLAGQAWPLSRPALTGHAELRAARLLVPGLTEPLNLPRVGLRVDGDQIVVAPVVAVLGTSVFSGRLTHQGERKTPWEFDLQAGNLILEQGAQWFDVLGRRQPLPLLERLPGLSSFTARRAAASNLFASLNARGRFAALHVTYRTLALKDFRASVEISGRVVRVANASFLAGGGRGQGSGVVDFTSAPARVEADVALTGGSVQALASRLPTVIRGARGSFSATGHLETRGLSHEEISRNLQGQATIRFQDLFLGDFDLLQAVARDTGWGMLEPSRGKSSPLSTMATLELRNRQVVFKEASFNLAGARLAVAGTYDFNGTVELDVRADLRHVRRRWMNHGEESNTAPLVGEFHMAGPLDKLVVIPRMRVSRAVPSY